MNKCYKIIIFILLCILIISHICSIIFESIYLSGAHEIKNIIIFILISDISFSTFIIIICGYLLYTALYFFSKNQIFLFLIMIFIFLIIKIFILIMFMKHENNNSEISHINTIIYIIYTQVFFLFITLVFGLFYRYKFNKEIDKSPLNRVDEFITEEMYNNILTQSLNPNDKELKRDFEKQFKQRKTENLYNSVNSANSSEK